MDIFDSRFFCGSIFVGIILLLPAPVEAKRIGYENPKAKSAVKRCKKKFKIEDKKKCMLKRIGGLELSATDRRLVWDRLFVTMRSPLILKPSVNPQSISQDGPLLKIVAVKDMRQFEKFVGNNPNQNQSDDILSKFPNKSKLIGRAVRAGRRVKKSTIAEIRLSDDLTVTEVVRGKVIEGLQQAGFNVLKFSADQSSDAIPMGIELNRFWVWHQNSGTGWGGYGDLNFVGEIEVSIVGSELPFKTPLKITTRSQLRGSIEMKKASWVNITTVLFKDFVKKISNIEAGGDGSAILNSSPINADLFRKAQKCQDKGGVWINDICQINID